MAAARILARSAVYRRLPPLVRARLDEAILRRPDGMKTLEDIAGRFELAKYRISPTTLQTYARRLEELARPAAAGQVMAAVLGCLPAGYKRRLMTGTHILLLSRVVQALSAGEKALSVPDLGRLASTVAAVARPNRTTNPTKRPTSSQPKDAKPQKVMEPDRIREMIRSVYGLNVH